MAIVFAGVRSYILTLINVLCTSSLFYTDFVFNIPDFDFDNPDVVHIVFGEALVSQPKHLHHFVVQGCSSRVPEDIEGRPLDSVPDHCNVPVGGFSGWAPGATIWGVPTNAGVAIGKGFGVS